MNILVIHEVDWKKKVVYEVHEFPELLSRRGHNVTFIDHEEGWKRENAFDLARFRTEITPNVHRAYAGGGIELRRPGLIKVRALRRISSIVLQYLEISRTLDEKQIDVILLYGMWTNGVAAVCAAKRAGVPVVFRAIDVLHGQCGPRYAWGVWLAERFTYCRVDRIIGLTRQMRDYVIGMGAHPERVEVMQPGIDQVGFKPGPRDVELMRAHGLKPSDKVAMFLGTMFEFSGLDYVIEHFPRVLKAVPGARLLLVGGGHSLARFRELARKHGVEREVAFTDFVSIDMLPRYINCSDVTINSFRMNKLTENVFPEKLPRYLACGKPLIATPLTATRGILAGEEHGVIFRELGPGFMDAMIELFTDPSRAERLGANALKYAREHHDWPRVIERLEGIFEREIARKRPAFLAHAANPGAEVGAGDHT